LDKLEIIEGFDENYKPKLRKATIPITLRMLLSHSSGGYKSLLYRSRPFPQLTNR
jgi:CubicO group peptidase (beta-lactamase class C family)